MAQQIAGIVWTVAQAETPAWTLLLALLVAALSTGSAVLLAMRRRVSEVEDDRLDGLAETISKSVAALDNSLRDVAKSVRSIDNKVSTLGNELHGVRLEMERRVGPLEARLGMKQAAK